MCWHTRTQGQAKLQVPPRLLLYQPWQLVYSQQALVIHQRYLSSDDDDAQWFQVTPQGQEQRQRQRERYSIKQRVVTRLVPSSRPAIPRSARWSSSGCVSTPAAPVSPTQTHGTRRQDNPPSFGIRLCDGRTIIFPRIHIEVKTTPMSRLERVYSCSSHCDTVFDSFHHPTHQNSDREV
jgi:hypothetical protein